MELQQFKKFFDNSVTKVKEANIPLVFIKDEMVKYNIIMYTLFANIYGEQKDKILPNYAELVHSLCRIALSSLVYQSDETATEFSDKFAKRYEEIKKAIVEDEEFNKITEETERKEAIINELIRNIGGASELPDNQHLRITDMFILTTIIMEELDTDFDYIDYLLIKSIKDLKALIPKTEEVKEESGKAEENPTTDNN